MPLKAGYDAVVVGSGPNGLAAALVYARAGRSVLVLEAKDTIGGGMRSAQLTLPGFIHDICSAFYPLGAGSPFFKTLPLADHGLKWIHPPAPLAHPLENGTAVVLERSLEATAAGLGEDRPNYEKLMAPLVARCPELMREILAPVHLPRHALLLARFGWRALSSARSLAQSQFQTAAARALFAGLAAHAQQPLGNLATAAYGLVLAMLGHAAGWPIVQGGSQRLAEALASCLRSFGSELRANSPITSFSDLPHAKVIFFDLAPRPLLRIMGERWPERYRRRLEKFRYGPGAFKMDWALDGPIPWKAAACARAGTVHVGGTFEEICQAEEEVARGQPPLRPFVLAGQQSLFDPSRAPSGRQTVWAYCHVPNGSSFDMSERIEAQIERFAPGFRDRILARSVLAPSGLERYNSNYIGGDMAGGSMELSQLFARPVFRWIPYATPAKGIYICSASTPPGGGVHGMCGYHAACAALRRELK